MYVDGFVLAVPRERLETYWELARLARDVWLEHGALSYVECLEDDVAVGELTSFPRAVMRKEDEVVVFAWITYADRVARDACNAKVMADPRMQHSHETAPFDGKRMIYGGFAAIVGG